MSSPRRNNGDPSGPVGFFADGSMFTDEERDAIKAVDAYKTANRKSFLSVTELLNVFKGMGYARTGGGAGGKAKS